MSPVPYRFEPDATAIEAPTDEQMAADGAAEGIEPLFDGAALERI